MEKRALIIGGGIAGPATALALAKAGWTPVVYEARPQSAADSAGVFLTLGSNGIDALHTLDAADGVLDHGFETPAIELRSYTGKRLGSSRVGTRLADGTTSRTMRRADLSTVLRDAVCRHGIPMEYRRQLVAIRPGGGGVLAQFADGGEERGDIAIGCDGIRSLVRSAIDPGAPAPAYAGLVNYGGFARVDGLDLPAGTLRMIFGRRAFFGYAVAPDGEVWWFANEPVPAEPTRDELAGLGAERARDRLHALFAGDSGPATKIIDASVDIAPGTPMHTLGHLPIWHRGRMVVTGDAAHAPSPSSGQGASLAIEDAVDLARCLRDLADPVDAFRHFERQRRPRVERIIKQAARVNNSKAATGIGRMFRDAILPIGLRMAGTRSMERTYGHHIDWDRPVLPT